METFFKDIRYAVRGLLKRPGFTAVAVITLALGIANTAIFSVVNAVLLQPLKFKSPEQLVMIWEEASFAGFPRNTPAPANYADWKAQSYSFEDMAAIAERSFNLTGDGEPDHVSAYGVTANFFPLLGTQPLLGRTFLTEEDRPEANKIVILSYQLWQTRYGGERAIVGSDILLNGEKHTVVGVMPAGFQFLDGSVRLWVPIALDQQELANRGAHYLTVVARTKSVVSVAQARAEIETIMSRISKDHPNETFNGKLGAVLVPLREELTGDSRRPLFVLLIAVAFVLLIACTNVASLMLSRAASRRREIAVRSALGASRLRIVRQMLTESVLLATCGGLLGLMLASWSFEFLEKLIPPGMALSTSLKRDAWMLLFAFSISILTAIVFGLTPALQAAQLDLNDALKQSGGRGAAAGGSALRRVMVVFEIALSLVLLIGAGLLIQTLFQLHNQYSVLEPEKILTLRTELPRDDYKAPAQRAAFYEQVLQRVENLPGVVSAGYSTSVPLSWKGGTSGFYPEGTKQSIPALKDQGRAGTGKRTRQYLGRTLVAVQVALSLLLLVSASLLIRSFRNLHQIDLGFNPEQVLIFDLAHSPQDRTIEVMTRTARDVRNRVAQIPGVQSASVSGLLLFGPSDISAPIKIQDNEPSQQEPIPVRFSSVSPGFFETVGMSILQGRPIQVQDSENGSLVAVINESMARRYFAPGRALGHWIEIPVNWRSPFEASKGRPIEIVGIVRDAKYNDLRADVKPMFYVPFQQMPRSLRSLEVGATLLLAIVAAVAVLIPARRATTVDPLVALRYE